MFCLGHSGLLWTFFGHSLGESIAEYLVYKKTTLEQTLNRIGMDMLGVEKIFRKNVTLIEEEKNRTDLGMVGRGCGISQKIYGICIRKQHR